MPEKLYFDGMHGIGDNINQRCFIKTLAKKGHEIWLKTPLPEIYAGIPNLHFVHANSPLRTQRKNERLSAFRFVPEPPGIPRRRIFYGNSDLQIGSIFEAMESQFGTSPAQMDLPRYVPGDVRTPAGKPVAVIRPTTERKEWHNASRGPLNQYIDDVSRLLAIHGFHVISVADLQEGEEWIALFREAIRIGTAKGEAELRGALYKRARNGDVYAYNELMRLSRSKDSD